METNYKLRHQVLILSSCVAFPVRHFVQGFPGTHSAIFYLLVRARLKFVSSSWTSVEALLIHKFIK